MKTAINALALLATLTAAQGALAAEKAQPAPTGTNDVERVNVDTIKEKYWARGDESELGVVQNRLYSKERKFELALFGGTVSTDPFLSVKTVGGTFGFHFSEYLSAHFVGWKAYVNPSSALETFQQIMGATTNNNPQRSYLGVEGLASVLYGKLSLVGKAIIYYDFHLIGGAGRMATDNGNYFCPNFGLGQQVYLAKFMSLRVDYRVLPYREAIIEKVVTPRLGQLQGYRTNWSHSVTLGVSFLLETFK